MTQGPPRPPTPSRPVKEVEQRKEIVERGEQAQAAAATLGPSSRCVSGGAACPPAPARVGRLLASRRGCCRYPCPGTNASATRGALLKLCSLAATFAAARRHGGAGAAGVAAAGAAPGPTASAASAQMEDVSHAFEEFLRFAEELQEEMVPGEPRCCASVWACQGAGLQRHGGSGGGRRRLHLCCACAVPELLSRAGCRRAAGAASRPDSPQLTCTACRHCSPPPRRRAAPR